MIRDRGVKQRLLRDDKDTVTGLAFKTSGKHSHLFVSTVDSVLLYNVTLKDCETEVSPILIPTTSYYELGYNSVFCRLPLIPLDAL